MITIPKDMIGAIIGPGGKIIQGIQAETGTVITIEEIDGYGKIEVCSQDKQSIEAAMEMINAIIVLPEVNQVYKGKIKSIVPFGAFVEIMPGKEGLLHISEIEWKRLENVEDVLKEGQEVEVKLIEVDEKTGKLRLSRKALLPKPEGYTAERRPSDGGDRRSGGRRDDRGGDRGGDRKQFKPRPRPRRED